MTKYIYCAIIALIAISCTQNDDDSLDNIIIDQQVVIPNTLNAEIHHSESRAVKVYQPESWNESERVDSRTYAVVDPADASEYYQYWSEGDAISVFFTTANLKYKLQNFANNIDAGVFELDGVNTTGTSLRTDYFYSIYPYKENTSIDRRYGDITYYFPEVQYYKENSYANGANGMIAIAPIDDTNSKLYFKNFCSYLQLRLKKPSQTNSDMVVQKIILESNNEDNPIAGEGIIYLSDDDVPCVEMEQDNSFNSITLDCGNGVQLTNDYTNFWFVLPAIENDEFIGHQFSNGFEITVIFKDGPRYRKTTQNTISIERNHIKPMVGIETEIQITDATIIYKYKNPDTNTTALPFINKEDDKNFTDENGNLLNYTQTYNEETQEWYVTFPEGDLKNIGNNVFDFGDTYDLDYIIVNNDPGINITNHAFYNTTAESIEFYKDVNVIEHNAFGASDIIDIQINGNVTTIATSAFDGSVVENVNIQGNVTTIEENAFFKSSINNLEIQGTVKNIGTSAFQECYNLTSISLKGVETIGWYALKYCRNLTSAEIQVDDTTILTLGEGVFADCESLTTIILDAKIPPVFIHDNSESDGPYIFPSGAKIHVPNVEDYKKADYIYPNNDNTLKNEWPKYYSSQLVEKSNP